MWTEQIISRILEGFRYDTPSDNHHKIMTFSTSGVQLYAFLHSLGLSSVECLTEISNKTRTYTETTPKTNYSDTDCLLYPKFGSSIVFELSYNSQNEKFIRIKYNNIPVNFGCELDHVDGYYCPYSKFENIVTFSLLSESYKASCLKKLIIEPSVENMLITEEQKTTQYIILCISSVIVAALLGICWCCTLLCNKRKDKGINNELLKRGYEDKQIGEMQ